MSAHVLGRPPIVALKTALSHGGSGPPSNTWFLELTRVNVTNGITVTFSSAAFAELTVVTDSLDRQTDRPTDHDTPSVAIDRV